MIKGDRKSNYDYRDTLPVNLTAVIREIKGDQGYLLSHDGLTAFAVTNGVARGGTFNERFNQHYRVSGDFFESVSALGVVTTIGQTAGDEVCSFSNSFNTQAILSDGKLWLWDNTSLLQVTDPDLGFPIDITWFRGIYVMTDGEFLFHTDIANEFAISPLKYSSSEFSSDKILAVADDGHNQIYAFNRYSTEVFYFDATVPTGTSVLVNINAASNQIGIVGTKCQVLMDGVFFILGGRQDESPSVHILNAGQEVTIATREIDKLISKYTESELAAVILEARVVDRDKFIIIHLPCETLLYNHTVGKSIGIEAAWSYVKSGVDTDNVWRAVFGVFDPRATKWIYGDKLESKLGYLDKQTAGQYGERVESICYTPIIKELETLSIDEFEIDTISGYTSNDFTSAFSMSYDGVFYGTEYWNLISISQGYNKRYIARRIGYIQEDFNFKFRFASVDKMAFSGLTVTFS